MSATAIHTPERSGLRVGKDGRFFLPLLLMAMAMLVLAGAGGALVLKAKLRPSAPQGISASSMPGYAPLPAMTFTLNAGSRLREVSVRVVLELASPDEAAQVAPFVPRIADAMNGRMLDVSPDSLKGSAGSSYIKSAVSEVANRELRSLRIASLPAGRVLIQDMLLR
ncbi:flagellar basal body-associated FliL family protein [Azospirillum sp. SYSU D00513]|uniref:flagellar basal body-associated FliL family protein n=1 Tax=Azospirillum sp. SYSU D00513 TaxID=2812561 RepID=UPI001A959A3D|nr:flagellar basal body-associated FliL family protein [Azospirillum sp. SYSU D00513]